MSETDEMVSVRDQYKGWWREIGELMPLHAPEDSPEGKRLSLVGDLVKYYEDHKLYLPENVNAMHIVALGLMERGVHIVTK